MSNLKTIENLSGQSAGLNFREEEMYVPVNVGNCNAIDH
jgi:hypothetical protein